MNADIGTVSPSAHVTSMHTDEEEQRTVIEEDPPSVDEDVDVLPDAPITVSDNAQDDDFEETPYGLRLRKAVQQQLACDCSHSIRAETIGFCLSSSTIIPNMMTCHRLLYSTRSTDLKSTNPPNWTFAGHCCPPVPRFMIEASRHHGRNRDKVNSQCIFRSPPNNRQDQHADCTWLLT